MLGLDTAYLCTKFDDCSFSLCRDMVDAHQNLNGSRDLTTPLSAMICHLWASTCYEQPISISTHYEDMKGNTKYQK